MKLLPLNTIYSFQFSFFTWVAGIRGGTIGICDRIVDETGNELFVVYSIVEADKQK